MNWVGRTLYRAVGPIIPHLPGWSSDRVRVVVLDDNNNILLVRSWLSRQQWTMPGGGVEEHESHEHACVRELREETGLYINTSQLEYLTTLRSERMKANLPIFIAETHHRELQPLQAPYKYEIIDRKWWPLDELPPTLSRHTKQALELVNKRKT